VPRCRSHGWLASGLSLVLGIGASTAAGQVRGQASTGVHDPALVMGTLPNGIRYYLRRNTVPARRVEFRLAINAGSVLEDEDQKGFAHFLEHMAFNGTTHFPGHSLLDFLESNGMRFGADLNAYTTEDETVYRFTLPSEDPAIVSRGLDVLQDWAGGGITIDSTAVVAERGVIMGEWRSRLLDTASQIHEAHVDSLVYGNTRYPIRKPIGDTALIQAALPGPIRHFYRDWYRPDLTTVIVVGDFHPATMEREVRRRFGAIPRPPNPRPRPNPVLPRPDGWTIDVFEGTANPAVELLWPQPTDPPTVRDIVRQHLVQTLLMETVNERLLRLRAHPSRPFISAQWEQGRLARPVAVQGVSLLAWPDSLERGLGAVLIGIERVAQHGVPAATLDRQKAVLLTHLEHAAIADAARPSQVYADAYVSHALTGDGALLSAAQELAMAREILPTITPEVIALAAQFWRATKGGMVLVTLPAFAHVNPPTKQSILTLIDSIARTPVPADTEPATVAGPLMATRPTPGHIVSERLDHVAGITEWTLSNGAHVIVKPTRNDPDALLVRAWSPGGFAAMPDSIFQTPGRMVAKVMTDVGGLGRFGHDALLERLGTTGLRGLKVDIGYADQSIDLTGSPTDLETVFQLMYLQFTAPMLDTATLSGWQSLAKYEGTGYSINDQLNQLVALGEKRMLPVSTQLADLVTVPQLLAVYRDRFGNPGGFTYVIVGAVSPGELRPMVERYLASLPGTGQPPKPKAAKEHPEFHRLEKVDRSLDLPKAITLLAFDDTFPSAADLYLRERERLAALTQVLQEHFRIRLRQELGATYSPVVESYTYMMPEERYRLMVYFDAEPRRMHQLNKELMAVLDTVRTHEVSAADATRASAIQHRQLEIRLQDNEYWMTTIGTYLRLGIPFDKIPAPYPEATVSPAEILTTARRYLPDWELFHYTMMPSDSTSYTTPGSTSHLTP